MTLGEYVKEKRVKAKKTRKEVARYLGIKEVSYGRKETNVRKVTVKELIELSWLLDFNIQEVVQLHAHGIMDWM